MIRSLTLPLSIAIRTLLFAQPPVPPPVGTDLNSGLPSDWTIENPTTGFVWGNSVGYGGSGGLIMDCGGCPSYQESTLWSPWLDLSSDPLIDITFKCAIIGTSTMVPPPIFVRRDGVGGSSYEHVYGFAGLIPPPNEVIPSTINPFPPLDPGNVQWVDLTYSFYAGLNDDSVRIGLGSGIPLGGWALLDDIGIGGLPTSITSHHVNKPMIIRNGDDVTVQSDEPMQRLEIFDTMGRMLRLVDGNDQRSVGVPLGNVESGVRLLRVWLEDGPVTMRIGL
ncbi:MAG: hypothetical protein IPG10_11430 [Flavobacteriales bacterium]|jgi:hypothetical protein|nr:hypothetical protein [Flavobacteriales bacterium]MBK7269596.1 hypothetical protein [Flavobacteriales bacterium]MBK7753621.1 hypothetical protein [Flavobacteriales bacterium]MBK9075292.1 hypothetical protein [Flavobacteriales bacterium]